MNGKKILKIAQKSSCKKKNNFQTKSTISHLMAKITQRLKLDGENETMTQDPKTLLSLLCKVL